ncbi:hypothetical protein RISK_000282 [Rhodopirellula islandica]|uniref:Uncharacterized protein n=1 Tax=Rhodopirellula islandica TaxID=595434 RepID=A0A0J1BMQ8_RHOIS|nr:hypothetical protein RISK_000282 [Rhodopirellula islandica]
MKPAAATSGDWTWRSISSVHACVGAVKRKMSQRLITDQLH